MVFKIPSVTFNNGIQCPILGLGTWKSEPGKVIEAVKIAIDAGYRHLDCAPVYLNEKEVGEAIKQKINEGVITREELFVTSKLPSNKHKAESVLPTLQKTLNDLGLDYLDLYLIHSPMSFQEGDSYFPRDENGKIIFSDIPCTETWQAMEKLVEDGLVKSIGISNFNSEQIDDILAISKITPVTNQVECHPYLNQKKLKEFCENKGILITAYSPLGTPDRPMASENDPVLLEDQTLLKIANTYKKSAAQILIKYQVQRGNIVIPKSITKSRIIENADIFDFTLKDDDFNALDNLNTKMRYCSFNIAFGSKYYPFNIEF